MFDDDEPFRPGGNPWKALLAVCVGFVVGTVGVATVASMVEQKRVKEKEMDHGR